MTTETKQASKPVYKKWWFWLIAVIVIVAIAKKDQNPTQQPSKDTSAQTEKPQVAQPTINIPSKQSAFVQAVESVKSEYESAPNELKKSSIRTKRGKLIQAALKNTRNILGWVGTISDMQTNSDGKAILAVQLEGANITLKTWNNGLSDAFDNTLIPQGSKLYSTVAELSKGVHVIINGSFLDSDKSDYVKESSMTENGSMTDPEFIFRFSSIKIY